MIDELLRRRALIVVGKGGVGRTSVSGALAILRAAGPARVLAMEYDRLGALATAMGRKPGFDPVKAMPGVWTAVLDGAHQLEEYLSTVVPSRGMLKAVVSSGAYRYFVEAAPGLRELIMVGKIYHELEYHADCGDCAEQRDDGKCHGHSEFRDQPVHCRVYGDPAGHQQHYSAGRSDQCYRHLKWYGLWSKPGLPSS